ncbi:UV DNA damage repair endonuclease UvsE [Paenibacillus alginolyticus]|uniref:UV DNA damage repair endonuclease UvsE n=1 Tax=Paenibacillus alginolyticus TaxID=59839 RepID=A0ABT4G822_9BACL|nr:UV DNA damage repair endonuclease UvsE [Paenibacillus alginolyticus]MCY9669737.1 UV DNA damage repair endonuclease UvsE [Paenibacillus alginolyticus]MCY9692316.1 UV DNA damage repair endonuclease UvsE [Paenibacillus alginolyticus]MEC0145843.1 UV DNA damage repair endonuclease UvsE [Paenibacillus alginolyticus]
MIIRLGFVSIAMAIFNNTPSSTFTYKLFSQRPREEALQRAIEIGRKNLEATQRILYYNAAHGIRLFRLSSSLIPLATHPDVRIDVAAEYKDELRKLGQFANTQGIRLSMHPNQFTLLNGSDSVVEAAIRDLSYHAAILDGMGLDESAIINIHVGGVYGDKDTATERLFTKISEVPEQAMRRLTFENDDKTYTLEETLAVSKRLQRPCMLDLHHDWCNPSASSPIELLPDIAKTWGDIPMKIHVSSPKDAKEFRSHSDYIEPDQLIPFLKSCKEAGLPRIDVMIEAKMKDLALFRLAEQLGKIRGVKRVDGGVLTW